MEAFTRAESKEIVRLYVLLFLLVGKVRGSAFSSRADSPQLRCAPWCIAVGHEPLREAEGMPLLRVSSPSASSYFACVRHPVPAPAVCATGGEKKKERRQPAADEDITLAGGPISPWG